MPATERPGGTATYRSCRVGGHAVVKGGSRLIGVAPTIFDKGKAKTGAGSGGAWEHAASRPLQTNMTPARSTYVALERPRSMDVPSCRDVSPARRKWLVIF